MSEVDDKIEDALIEAASVPDLATLFKRGKDAGLIQPARDYGHPAGA